jgi:hypothetical protein
VPNQRRTIYESVIIHVGTNVLVNDGGEKVAKVELLFEEVKNHTKKMIVSSVTKRYYGRVNSCKKTPITIRY